MTSTNKKNKRKSYKREEVNEWRLAKRARPGAFTSNTNVICLIECEDDDSEKDHEFFIGTIVKEVDGHVKVHLSGLGRKDDIWLEQDSENLLLDEQPLETEPNPVNVKYLRTKRDKLGHTLVGRETPVRPAENRE